ncbi:hypothetical protein [Endomicrobium proavitum]|uniref:Uncharacterized protein n=1 Tax=Endomicrobium proavitum TaxID=1408281 RepID=A0A0G3WKA8_9BACT|nr:hypothetical protein [Endomicrobium proavitum]AKL98312.1 hypothetical protein Epro_0933 [Endomicrobium proavitum]
MKIHFSNQGNLRNFRNFVNSVDFSEPEKLEISTHDKWIAVHPANIVIAAALALKVGRKNACILGKVPKTGLYLDRMGLYSLTNTSSPFAYDKKESSGRFVPLTIIKTANEQSHFC